MDVEGDPAHEIYELTQEQAGIVSEIGVELDSDLHKASVYLVTNTGEKMHIHTEPDALRSVSISAYYKEE